MSQTVQVILAIGICGLFLLAGSVGVIWALRCDPKRPHYRLPVLATVATPMALAILALFKGH